MRLRPLAALAAAVTVAVPVVGACGREPAFEDRTARVTIDGETTTFTVDSCGLDGETVFVVGRADDGEVVQAVVGVEADGETGVPASTGVSVIADDGSYAAFGAEAWTRRGGQGGPPGTIDSARVRGARIQAGGQVEPVDDADRPTGGEPVDLGFDARCDADDEG